MIICDGLLQSFPSHYPFIFPPLPIAATLPAQLLTSLVPPVPSIINDNHDDNSKNEAVIENNDEPTSSDDDDDDDTVW